MIDARPLPVGDWGTLIRNTVESEFQDVRQQLLPCLPGKSSSSLHFGVLLVTIRGKPKEGLQRSVLNYLISPCYPN